MCAGAAEAMIAGVSGEPRRAAPETRNEVTGMEFHERSRVRYLDAPRHRHRLPAQLAPHAGRRGAGRGPGDADGNLRQEGGKDRCQSQVEKCRSGAADLCASAYAGEFVTQCIERYTPCCEFLKDCKTAQALECVVQKYEDTKK